MERHVLPSRLESCPLERYVTSFPTADRAARLLIADAASPWSFFVWSARDLLRATLWALHLTRAEDWTLADVLAIVSDPEKHKALLNSAPEVKDEVECYFDTSDRRTLAVIREVLASSLASHSPHLRIRDAPSPRDRRHRSPS